MIQPGNPDCLGNSRDGDGVNFALYASNAEAVELCLFDTHHRQRECCRLPGFTDGVWHGYLPKCKSGQRYGYRVHGPWMPSAGLRHNPSKLLIDPYARELDGTFSWAGAVFDYDLSTFNGSGPLLPNTTDSAAHVPKSVVSGAGAGLKVSAPEIPWSETIIYEANLRAYTMRHPNIPEHERGRFLGMSNGQILKYLKALGITSLELLPVHAFIDEAFLVGHGLRNLWGYNSINFFSPEVRYAARDAVTEFREMVDAIHDAGIEVILDVVYNHTGEGDVRGPSLSYRGIDNLAYYRTETGDPANYVNDTGCGNTLNTCHPVVRTLVLDSLVYWHRDMGVDGFRFDLGTVLGRTAEGFDPQHELLQEMTNHPQLAGIKMIAEPWDVGPDGYQLGRFPTRWAEWNDRYRDTLRRFWRGEEGLSGDLATRLLGSGDIFSAGTRSPSSSINFITSHDGFTLYDLVSFADRHNTANGEDNQDGHRHNFSCNYGVEGPTTDSAINHVRRRQRLNMLASLLLSGGTPMLLAGDEFGNTQAGNNNAYAQDNTIGWLDWRGLESDPEFTAQVRSLLRLRHELSGLYAGGYQYGGDQQQIDRGDAEWLSPAGEPINMQKQSDSLVFTLLPGRQGLSTGRVPGTAGQTLPVIAILFNASEQSMEFNLPQDLEGGDWQLGFCSGRAQAVLSAGSCWRLPPHSIACARYETTRSVFKEAY